MKKQIAVIGGGAAGYFYVANASHIQPEFEFTIFEQGKQGLQKVKISGGGRCNVTNSCTDPKQLIENYPRGNPEMLGPLYQFGTEDVHHWFEQRGVPLYSQEDGRVFPISNSSQSIIDCLNNSCNQTNVRMQFQSKIKAIIPLGAGEDGYRVVTNQEEFHADMVVIATGGSKMMWSMLKQLNFAIVPPVPSLFTFQIKDQRISQLAGITVDEVELTIPNTKFASSGSLLITHKGISGPATLKLSSFAARYFNDCNYHTPLYINFLPDSNWEEFRKIRDRDGNKSIESYRFHLPKRLTKQLIASTQIDPNKHWAKLSNQELQKIYHAFCKAEFQVIGQNISKDEFVTAGGVDLKEINFKNFSSKRYANLYFAGEVLNIDALTGGYNFQAAWTGAFLAAADLE